MRKKTKRVLGIILIVISVIFIISKISLHNMNGYILSKYNIHNPVPFYVQCDENLIYFIISFVMLFGGVMLLINFKKKTAVDTEIGSDGLYVLQDAEQVSDKRNTICTIALIVALVALVLYSLSIFIVPPLVALVLGIIGLKKVLTTHEKGEGFAKWSITIGLSEILAVIFLFTSGVIANLNGISANIDDYTPQINSEIDEVNDIEKISYSKGVCTGNNYESKFLDLRFTAPDGWVLRSDEEIKDAFGEVAYNQTEMSAVNLSSGENVYVFAEKLPTTNATLAQYKEAIKINWTKSGLEFSADKGSIEFLGKTYDIMEFNSQSPAGMVKSETYIRIQDDRLIYFMMQYLDGNRANIETALSAFAKY